MVAFNPQSPAVDIPSGLGYSHLSGNAPGGIMLKTAASVLDTGVKVADSLIDKGIENQVGAAVDKVQNLYGKEAGTPDVNDTNLPPNLQSGLNKLDALYEGYQNGTIKESHMYGLLNAYLKQIKANNPGYEENVDKWMSSKGYSPANQLVSSIRQEAEADLTRRNSLAKDRLDYEEANSGKISLTLGEDYWTNPEKRNMPFDQVIHAVSLYDAKQADMTLQSNALQLKVSQHTVQQNDYEDYARSAAANYSAMVANRLGDGLDKEIKKFQEGGQTHTAEEVEALRASFASKKLEMQRGLQKSLSEDKTQTWFHLDQKTRDDIVASATAPLDVIGDAITNKDYGLANAAGNLAKQLVDTQKTKLLGSDTLRNAAAAKEILGDAGLGAIIANNLGEFEKAITTATISKVVTGRGETDQIQGGADVSIKDNFIQLSNADKNGQRIDPKFYKTFIDTNIKLLADPGVKPEGKARIVQYMFGNNDSSFFDMFHKDASPKVFAAMVNPGVTKTIKALSEGPDGNPQIWQNYSNWAYKSYSSLVKQYASDIAATPDEILSGKVIKYNESRGQIEVVSSGEPRSVGEDPLQRIAADDVLQSRFNDLNILLSSIKPVVDAEGLDLGTTIKQQLKLSGIPINVNDDGRNEGDGGSNELRGSAGNDQLLDTSSFLDFIGQAEGASYDTMYGEQIDKPNYSLSNKTINEVMALQREVGGSGAAGKYQIQRATLSYLKKALGLSGDEFFTPEMQDQLGQALLQRRGLEGFARGEISKERFAHELSKEWASLPSANGQSFWQGTAGNKASKSLDEVYQQLGQIGFVDNFKPNT